MSIELKQFAGSSVKPDDDARLYSFMLSNKTGVVEGIEVTHLGANQLKISAGWGICCGRMFEVMEATVSAATSADGAVKGRLLINIDVSADVPATFMTQAAANLPELVQENINGSGTVYQIPLAEYMVDELQCSNLTEVKKMLEVVETSIQKAQQTADTAKTDAANAQTTADKAMPKSGGTFAGDVVAYSTNRDTSGGCVRNCVVVSSGSSPSENLVSTNSIIFSRS